MKVMMTSKVALNLSEKRLIYTEIKRKCNDRKHFVIFECSYMQPFLHRLYFSTRLKVGKKFVIVERSILNP